MTTRMAIAIGALAILPITTATPAEAASSCKKAKRVLVTTIASRLDTGLTLRKARIVRSSDYKNVYFVAADIEGPGLEGGTDVGVWATNSTTAPNAVFSVDHVAKEFTDWTFGADSSANVTMGDDGADKAKSCAGG